MSEVERAFSAQAGRAERHTCSLEMIYRKRAQNS